MTEQEYRNRMKALRAKITRLKNRRSVQHSLADKLEVNKLVQDAKKDLYYHQVSRFDLIY